MLIGQFDAQFICSTFDYISTKMDSPFIKYILNHQMNYPNREMLVKRNSTHWISNFHTLCQY